MARKLTRLCGAAAILLIAGSACSRKHQISGASAAPVPGQLIVHVDARTSLTQDSGGILESLKLPEGARIKAMIPQLGAVVVSVPAGSEEKSRQTASKAPGVDYVDSDYFAKLGQVPNDPGFTREWHLQAISAPAAWDTSTGDPGVQVAVIDSGVDATHPDLVGRVLAGHNFVTGTNDTRDLDGHGTAVAGALGAAAGNGAGIAGVTWQNPILPLAVVDSKGLASYSNIAAAIVTAVDSGARIINISLGGTQRSALLDSAVLYAWTRGALVFAAAMNDANNTPHYPAASPFALAISSVGQGAQLSSFSDFGPWISFAAPGELIWSTGLNAQYAYYQGTSFSSPIAAGVAALVLGARPALSNANVVDILKSTATSDVSGVFSEQYGFGRLNAAQAVAAALVYPINIPPPQVPSITELGIAGGNTMNPPNLSASGAAIPTFDGQGNLFFGGSTSGALGGLQFGIHGFTDAYVSKLSPAGALLWVSQLGAFQANSYISQTFVDSAGNPVICGSTTGSLGGRQLGTAPVGGATNVFAAKFSGSGSLAWVTQFGGATPDGVTQDASCRLDSAGDVLLTATRVTTDMTVSRLRTALIAKVAVDGQVKWQAELSGVTQDVLPEYLALDSSGAVVVAGLAFGPLGGHVFGQAITSKPGTFLAKYDSNGNRVWLTELGASGEIGPTELVQDPTSGDWFLSGVNNRIPGTPGVGIAGATLIGAGGGADTAFVARFGFATGALAWINEIGDGVEIPAGSGRLLFDPTGGLNFYGTCTGLIGSNLIGTHGANDAYAIRMDNSGALKWSIQLGSGTAVGLGFDVIAGMADSAGALYLGFQGISQGGPQSAYTGAHVARISSSGALLWTRDFGVASGVGAGFTSLTSLALDPASGEVLVNGFTLGALGGTQLGLPGDEATSATDGWIARLDASGTQKWLVQFGAGGQMMTDPLLLDASGRAYFLGVTIASSPLGTQYGAHGATDAFFARFNADGSMN